MVGRVFKGAVFWGITVIVLLSLPLSLTERLRQQAIQWIVPFNENFQYFSNWKQGNSVPLHDYQKLELELQLAKNDNQNLRELLTFHKDFSEYPQLKSSYPAQVIYRSASTWGSVLWINVGEVHNKSGRNIVGINSPVLVGTGVVGLVERVGERCSKVRLISDSSLVLSVRVKRGRLLLAKGEIRGESAPLWRSHRILLRGTGFNYDFSDDEGPARDLRSGAPVGKVEKGEALVTENDLLVTTGMDGIFPPGLQVAEVTKVMPLKDGDYYYDLEAKPVIKNMGDLLNVLILPPLEHPELRFGSIVNRV